MKTARAGDHEAPKFAGGFLDFKLGMIVRNSGFGIPFSTTESTIQANDSFIGRLFGRKRNPCTNAADLHFTNEQSERSPPVVAFASGDTGDDIILRDIEPSEFAIDYEKIGFEGSILPTHFSGAAKISNTGFATSDFAAFAVLLQKFGLEGARTLVSGFELLDVNVGVSRSNDRREKNQKQKNGDCRFHDLSLAFARMIREELLDHVVQVRGRSRAVVVRHVLFAGIKTATPG